MRRIFLITLFAAIQWLATLAATAETQTPPKAVLVTGASTGIGRATAELLAEQGYIVFAGARKDSDLKALSAIHNIEGVRLDITKPEEISAAVATIEAAGHGLWGLVNNAGINIIDPMIEADMDDLEWLFQVNVFGMVRVTQAFSPMIIESKGRIVNISSISGILTGLTAYGGYAMTKHAVEAFSDQLASELQAFGVHVAAVEPGNFGSQIGMTRCKGIVEKNRQYTYYAEAMKEHQDYCAERVAKQSPSPNTPPKPVAKVVMDALSSDSPSEHYLITSHPVEAKIVMLKSFERILNYNKAANHGFSQEQLIDMLKEEEAALRGEIPPWYMRVGGDEE